MWSLSDNSKDTRELENLKIEENHQFSALVGEWGSHPPAMKNPDFLETGCSDHLETLAIDSTH